MLNRVIKENDLDCSHTSVERMPKRKGYIIRVTARYLGKPVQENMSFTRLQIIELGMNQAKKAVMDFLLVRLNLEK